MNKIISQSNNEIITNIDKNKTPVFNLSIEQKFPQNSNNNEDKNKSKNMNEKSFNDEDEFDDIQLCDNPQKSQLNAGKIPKLDLFTNISEVGYSNTKDNEKK